MCCRIVAVAMVGFSACSPAPPSPSAPAPVATIAPTAPDRAACPPARPMASRERLAFVLAEEVTGSTRAWRISGATLAPWNRRATLLRRAADGRLAHLAPPGQLVRADNGDGALLTEDGIVILVGDAPPRAMSLEGVSHAAFSPDGARLYVTDELGQVRRIDSRTGVTEAEARAPDGVATDVIAGDDVLLVQSGYGLWSSLDPSSLTVRMPPTQGTPSPRGRRFATYADDTLSLVDPRTGKVEHRRRDQRADQTRVVALGDDWIVIEDARARLLVWDLRTHRTRVASWLDLGEADAESRHTVAMSADGRFLCQAMDSADAVFDLQQRHQLHDRPGLGVHCRIEDGMTWVLRVALEPKEIMLQLPGEGFGIHADFVMNPERTRAALLVTDGTIDGYEERPLRMLIVDLASQAVLHRIELGTIARGGWMPRLGLDDADRVLVRVHVAEPPRLTQGVTVDWATGEQAAVRDEPDGDLALDAGTAIRGTTLLMTGPRTATAWRLDAPEKAHRTTETRGCRALLSPLGSAFLRFCDETGSSRVLGLDGTDRSLTPRMAASSIRGIAVADDGAVAFAGDGAIELHEAGRVKRLGGPDPSRALAFAPDGRHLAAWEPQRKQLVLWDRDRVRARWRTSVAVPSTPRLRFVEDRLVVGDAINNVVAVLDTARGLEVPLSPDHHHLLTFGSLRAHTLVERLRARHEPAFDGVLIDQVAVVPARGRAEIYRTNGEHVATLYAEHAGGVWAFFDDGRLDGLGVTAFPRETICIEGTTLVDMARCQALRDDDALARTFGAACRR